MSKAYLGGGVYACVNDGTLILTAENSRGETNIIYLEYETLASLMQYVNKLKEEARKRLSCLGSYEEDEE